MRRFVVFAPSLVLALCCGLAPRPACAQVPDPRSTVISPSKVLGTVSGNTLGTNLDFSVNLRDVTNAPRPGELVVLRFVAPELKLFAEQNAGTTLDCGARRLSKLTDAQGFAKFRPRFGSFAAGPAVEVWAGETEFLGGFGARSTDLDGTDGRTGLGDLARFSSNFLNLPSAQETDFDLSGTTGLGDYTIFVREFLSNAQGSYCP